tara:strand:+ start:1400 stop:1870 length:471 start_codon:yes stop_codon:yes gene_type:complete
MDKYFLDKIKSNREILRNFLKPTNNKYKTKKKVKEFLLEELFNINCTIYYFVKDKRIDSCYTSFKILKNNIVILNIPIEDTTIALTIDQAKRINIIGPYYQDSFNENKINFKYYDKENKCVRNGPDLIITTLTSDNIFYKIDDQDIILSEFLKKNL